MEDYLNEFKISAEAKEKLKDKEHVEIEFMRGKSAQEVLGFSHETMAKFYRAAYHLFEEHQYVDAANSFLFLVTLDYHQYDYWLGLGMSTQMYGDFEFALDAYEMAANYQIDNPVPYFYMAKCLFAMHERKSAEHALELAIEHAGDIPEYEDLKNQAIAAQELLKKHN